MQLSRLSVKILLIGAFLALSSFMLLVLAIQTSSTGASDQKIRLGVFMESLCPDSKRFFLQQLVPTHRDIGQIMELKIVPFGHARTIGNNRMVCQHGPRECEGNRRMACLISRSKNQSEIVETLGCLFKVEFSVEQCLAEYMPKADYNEVERCMNSDESYQLMVQAEKDSGRLGYVPHLTVNEQWSEEIQYQAENNLKAYICNQYKGLSFIEKCKDADTQ